MKSVLKNYVRPVVITGKGTTKDAMSELYYYLKNSLAFPKFGTLGKYNHDGNGHAFGYSIEVSKRGRHRDNKTFRVNIYRISERWLKENRKTIVQHKRYFRLVDE